MSVFMNRPISVIIVDDHPLVLSGFTLILAGTDEIVLEAAFTNASDGIRYLEKNQVDVVLLDIHMPGTDGVTACEQIKKLYSGCYVIAVSNNDEGSMISRMLQAGASGYLLKNSSAGELINGIKNAASGAMVLSPAIKKIMESSFTQAPLLTRREKEVLLLLADGFTTPEIAGKLFVSPLTVESHRRNLLQKFKVVNSAALVRKATEMKYI